MKWSFSSSRLSARERKKSTWKTLKLKIFLNFHFNPSFLFAFLFRKKKLFFVSKLTLWWIKYVFFFHLKLDEIFEYTKKNIIVFLFTSLCHVYEKRVNLRTLDNGPCVKSIVSFSMTDSYRRLIQNENGHKYKLSTVTIRN